MSLLVRRAGEGLAILTWIGGQHLLRAQLARVSPWLASKWARRIDRQGGPWLASYCRRHGALLTKIGQFVASRPDLLPLDYVDACAGLRDQARPSPSALIRLQLDVAYEHRTADHLARIDDAPIAAASFGQVHRAWLTDGTLVAVKIQHPGLAPLVACDLWLLRLSLRLFALVVPRIPLQLIAEEIARTAKEEQDYLHEGLAADRLRSALAGTGVLVPRVFWAHTREKVLVMEFATGTTLAQTDLATLSAERRRDIAGKLIDAYLTMLVEIGYFHCDPHAGNLIVDGDRLWLIDFGMTSTIDARERALYRRFLDRLRSEDTDGMVDVLCELGQVLPGTDRAALKDLARTVYSELGNLSPNAFKGSRRQLELGERVMNFIRRMEGLVLPRHTILLSRGMGLLEGVCTELVPDENFVQLARPRLRRLFSPWRTASEAWADLQRFWRDLRALPTRIEDALEARTAGPDLTPLLCAVLLVAALQLPDGWFRLTALIALALGLVVSLRRR
ncbi:hypothetical protein LBMAG53_22890 [Planctomycetota bacterium]|nr:hypothetical protein LBMAG53_22890 [Planctomycetota bacterium]